MNRNITGFRRFLIPHSILYLFVILALIVALTALNWHYAIPGYILLLALLLYNYLINRQGAKQIFDYVKYLDFSLSSASKNTLQSFPVPILVIGSKRSIIWYNSIFRDTFGIERLSGKSIQEFAESLKMENLISEASGSEHKNYTGEFVFAGRHYNIHGNYIKKDAKPRLNEKMLLLCFLDNTELSELKLKYDDEKTIVATIMIDNYDDLMQSMEDAMRPQMLAEIDKRIVQWFAFTSGMLKKFERDRYVMIFEHRFLKQMEDMKFDILDTVKEITLGNKIPVTLSMGFGLNGGSPAVNFQYAAASIEIALGRGGDQVVIKNGDSYSFYGGKTRSLEKRTKVKARVIAHALRDLIDESSRVIIMGHENCDIDCLGAALGCYRIVRNRNRDGYIILNEVSPAIEGLMEKIGREIEYKDVFIDTNEALDRIDNKTLLIIVDVHRLVFTESPEVIPRINRVVVIDHHRKGTDYIQDAVLTYQETYASSTCELVTEILQYIDDKPRLKAVEAEALYAGIVVDTKNFTIKAGVRTFEAASFLKRQGVDILSARQLLQNDITTYNHISAVVKNADIIEGNIAISICPSNIRNGSLIAAKAADEILSLQNIAAAFVLCEVNGEVNISGRSLGEINVQVILEKLGGGGHLTVAGTQIQGVTMEDALSMLKYAIIDYVRSIKKE